MKPNFGNEQVFLSQNVGNYKNKAIFEEVVFSLEI